MNSKNIFKSIFVIFAILLVMNTVFATEYITKRTDNKLLDTAYDVAKNNNITDIKIQSVSVVKKSGNSCLVTVSFMDKIPKYEKSNYKFYPHFLISISKKDTERYISRNNG